MGRRKLNMFPWSVGLVTLMTALCLIGAVRSSYARYQVNQSESIFYTPKTPTQICLGQMVTDENGQTVFDGQTVGSWTQAEGQSNLTFVVANGTGEDSYAEEDQLVQLRLVGSLGVWDGQQTIQVLLRIPKMGNVDVTQPLYDEIVGQAERISPESPLYNIFGDGWFFTFPDENGEEMTWLLEGESFSIIPMSITIEGIALTDPSLLQLTATGTFVPETP